MGIDQKAKKDQRRINMVFLSLSSRILVNVEALNMVESIGNFVRHRRAPIVVPTNTGFVLKYVPVISGESLAHAYQEIIADLGAKSNIKVCENCRAGYFIKHSDDSVLEDWAKKALEEGAEGFEKAIIENCVVEDIGGFLYAGEVPVKRTSRFQVGYMIPALDTVTSTAVEAQFHVRYAKTKEQQSIYNVEVGSAIYTFGFNLNIDGIGMTSSFKVEKAIPDEEREKRIELAIKALNTLMINAFFGAKRSRFMPIWEILNAVVVVSHPIPITADPPHTRNYIVNTAKKASSSKMFIGGGKLKFDESIWIGVYKSAEETLPIAEGVEEIDNLSKLFEKALKEILRFVKK